MVSTRIYEDIKDATLQGKGAQLTVGGQLLDVAINVDMDDHLKLVGTLDKLSVDGAHDVDGW